MFGHLSKRFTQGRVIMGMSGNPFAMGGNTSTGTLAASMPSFLQGFFGNSGRPYEKAGQEYQKYFNQAPSYQEPYNEAGQIALPQYQQWLQGQKDPSGFINNLMSKYQQSPWAKFATDQGMRANTNSASASGLIGSTPYQQAGEQYAHDISSQDMQQWLQSVLGINTQYGAGQHDLVQGGQHASDIISQLFQNEAQTMGQSKYGEEAGKQSDQNSIWAGITKLFGG